LAPLLRKVPIIIAAHAAAPQIHTVIFRYGLGIDKPLVKPMFPMVFDLASDPKEEFNLMFDKMDMAFMFAPAFEALIEYKLSLAKYPNIKPGEDFKGYRGIRQAAHDGKAAVAEYEFHHHAPN